MKKKNKARLISYEQDITKEENFNLRKISDKDHNPSQQQCVIWDSKKAPSGGRGVEGGPGKYAVLQTGVSDVWGD